MKIELLSIDDIASHFRVRHGTVRYWIKGSESPRWKHDPVPKPLKLRCSNRLFWLPEQLSEWNVWYKNFLRDKAYQSLVSSEKVKKEHEELRSDD